MSRLLSVCTQLSACGLEADEDDVAGHSAAGAALAMLKDYSDFFDAMTAAASVTENALMQPFVAWCVSRALSSVLIIACVCGCVKFSETGTAKHRWRGPVPAAAALRPC